MKLRRALTAVAATAVIAPSALLTAPTAYATGPETESAAASDTTPAAPDAGRTEEPATTPEAPAPGGDDTSGTTEPGDDGSSDGGAQTGDGADGGTDQNAGAEAGEGAGDDGATGGDETGGDAADDSTTPGTSGAQDGGTKPDEGKKPDKEKDPAEDEEPGDDLECAVDAADIKVTVAGMPSKLVAGGAWSHFGVQLTNTTDKTLDEVYPVIYAVPLEDFEHPQRHLDLEYQNPETGAWTAFEEWTSGEYFGWFQLDAHQTAELKLRIRADKGARPGDGFALVAGDYNNRDGSCGWSEERWYDFTILPAGSKPGEVPPAKPGKPGNRPGPQGGQKPIKDAKPQGGLEKLPVTGNLAETGASSALPTIALVAGVTMAVGAGAVFAVRRRRTQGAAAA